MLWKVRPPFAVHHEKVITTDQAGSKIKMPVVESHFAGETVDLDEKSSRKHLHKLEPADSEAHKLLDSLYADNDKVRSARGVPDPSLTSADVDARIEAAVSRALAAQAASNKDSASSGRGGRSAQT